VYAPLCDQNSWFDMFNAIRRFVRFVYEKKNTDNSRLYLVGASMGGYAVWQNVNERSATLCRCYSYLWRWDVLECRKIKGLKYLGISRKKRSSCIMR